MYRNVANEMSRDRNDQDRKVPWPQRPDRKGQIASARPKWPRSKWLRPKRPDQKFVYPGVMVGQIGKMVANHCLTGLVLVYSNASHFQFVHVGS